MKSLALCTAKRILERLHHRFSKFDKSVFLISKPISYFWGHFYGLVFLSRNYLSLLHHDLMVRVKAISIFAENLNSGHSYIITAVEKND